MLEQSNPTLAPIRPNECALALAIPLTREEFLADLSRPGQKDFVHHFVTERGLQRAEAEFCWEVYEADEATFVEAVCLEAQRLGVTVLRQARLADLTGLFKRFPVVTLVAHWRFVPVTSGDILDAPRILKLLRGPQSSVMQAIRQVFALQDSQLLEPEATARLSITELRGRVADVISRTADQAEKFYWDEATDKNLDLGHTPDGLTDNLTRLEFEQAFPDCIALARVVEFHDGMRTIPELVEAVPENFRGLLDLTICNSVIPAAPIRHKRNCLVAANRRPAELGARMYLYGLEISLLSKHSLSFIEAIKQVHTGKSACKGKGGKLWKLFGKCFNNILAHQ